MGIPVQVAVLDDYQHLSDPHFKTLDSGAFEVTTFVDTLLPYNHPDTPQETKDALVERLERFDVICRSIASPRDKMSPAHASQAPCESGRRSLRSSSLGCRN